jgi:acyl-CoA reductase-like NAD-dependent aldehyde dehydrogenase
MAQSGESVPVSKLYINGEWRAPRAGQYEPICDPATGEVLAQVARAGVDDTRDAIESARRAFDEGPWAGLCPGERSQILHRVVDAVEARQDELSNLEMRNAGSTWRKAFLMDIPVGVLHFRHFAKLADYEPLEPVPQITFPMLSYNFVQREPIGVCGQIIPWNFPFLMAIWKIAPALAAGNAVVLKPASLTPLSALKLVEIIHETGLLPPGVLNLVTGPGAAIGNELATSPLIDKIAFTGSTEVGREVMRQAAGTVKKVTLELGGKSPSIVLDDADLDVAIDGCLWATFMHNGQACESGTRLFVPDILYDGFMERLIDRAGRIRVGLPAEGDTDLGPVISAAQLRRVEEYIRIGLQEGATPALLGSRPDDPALANGHFITPTVFTDVRNDMRIAQEEIFGPVLSVIKYDRLEDAIRMANDTIYGLAAGVWGSNIDRAVSVAKQIRAGTIWINDFHMINAEAPFGGYKQSGIGRELGTWGLHEYTEVKHIHTAMTCSRKDRFWFDILLPQGGGEGED